MATTLITSEGRALTEVQMWVKNHAQPFLKVALPPGATIVSVEIAGEPAKPVAGDDGSSRVPLLRPGFRPGGPYPVSFVYLHPGTPFGRKGDLPMTLPRMDIPIGVMEWEVFAPENYSMRYVDGNAIARQTLDRALGRRVGAPSRSSVVGNGRGIVISLALGEVSGRIRGVVKDSSGAVLPGVTIEVASQAGAPLVATSASDGTFFFVGARQGIARITATLPGFNTAVASFVVGDIGTKVDIEMSVGSVSEAITVGSESPRVDPWDPHSAVDRKEGPSQNVIDLQRRVSGVLPIRIEVPRAGMAYHFSRPLVVNDETRLSFRYKRR